MGYRGNIVEAKTKRRLPKGEVFRSIFLLLLSLLSVPSVPSVVKLFCMVPAYDNAVRCLSCDDPPTPGQAPREPKTADGKPQTPPHAAGGFWSGFAKVVAICRFGADDPHTAGVVGG